MEIGKWKLENCEGKIPTRAVHEWDTRADEGNVKIPR